MNSAKAMASVSPCVNALSVLTMDRFGSIRCRDRAVVSTLRFPFIEPRPNSTQSPIQTWSQDPIPQPDVEIQTIPRKPQYNYGLSCCCYFRANTISPYWQLLSCLITLNIEQAISVLSASLWAKSALFQTSAISTLMQPRSHYPYQKSIQDIDSPLSSCKSKNHLSNFTPATYGKHIYLLDDLWLIWANSLRGITQTN